MGPFSHSHSTPVLNGNSEIQRLKRFMNLYYIFLKIRTEDIAYLKFILESYEGIGIVRTVDQSQGIVVLLVAEDFQATARSIFASLQQEIPLTEIPQPRNVGDDWLFKEMSEQENAG